MPTLNVSTQLDMQRLDIAFWRNLIDGDVFLFEPDAVQVTFDAYIGVSGNSTATLVGTGFGAPDANGFPTTGSISVFVIGQDISAQFFLEELSVTVADLRAAIATGDADTILNLFIGGDDVLQGNNASDRLLGGAGDDHISGGDEIGDNAFVGDGLDGGAGNDILLGGAGNDALAGGAGSDRIEGGNDADILSHNGVGLNRVLAQLVNGEPTHFRYAVADLLTDDGAVDTLFGGEGNDSIYVGLGDSADGGDGTDAVEVNLGSLGAAINLDLGSDPLAVIAAASGGTYTGFENWTLRGSSLGDIVFGSAGRDVLFGGNGADRLEGRDGDDVLIGASQYIGFINSGLTSLLPGSGAPALGLDDGVQDRLLGGAGDDYILVGLTDNAMGGDGIDVLAVTFDGLTTALDLDLSTGDVVAKLAALTGGLLEGFETVGAIRGTRLADTIRSGNVFEVYSGAGDDVLYGGTRGGAYLRAGAGNDIIHCSDLFTRASGGAGDDIVYGGAARDYLDGDADRETSALEGGDDILNGGGGDDSLYGNGGDDLLIGGTGVDFFVGGVGFDTASFASSAEGIVVTLTLQTFESAPGVIYLDGDVSSSDGAESTTSVEGFIGSAFADMMSAGLITSQDYDFSFDGADGKDQLTGGGGDDILIGGASRDRMTGRAGDDTYWIDSASDVVIEAANGGNDTIVSTFSYNLATGAANVENVTLTGDARINAVGNALNNVLIGNDNVNALNGSHGADRMEGKGGNDLYYVNDVGDVVVELAGGGTADTVRAPITYTLGEEVGRLLLVGLQQINAIGNAADNVIQGNLRPNVIIGMGGRDLMTGGAGADRFDFRAVSDSAFNAYDRITDLADEDVINLSGIDADTTVAGNQAFVLANAFTGQAGQLTLTYVASGNFTVLAADVNGDRVGDFRVILDGNHTDYDNFRL